MASRHSDLIVLADVHNNVHLDRSSSEVLPHGLRAVKRTPPSLRNPFFVLSLLG